MIHLPKPLAFSIFFLVTFLLADSLFDVSWEAVTATNSSFRAAFKELREPLAFVLLSLFYIHYYVGILKQEN